MRRREALVLSIAFAALAAQVLAPGFIGLANNGDFGKIAGPLSIGSADNGSENFLYFVSDYLRGPAFYYNPRLPSSEHALAWLASRISSPFDRNGFDIRWLGALHLLIWLAGFAVLLRSFRKFDGAAWWISAIAALVMFTDVAYVSYFNSFYTDAAALGGAIVMFAALPLLIGECRSWPLVVFACGALLFVTSKGQHAIWAVAPALILIAKRRVIGFVFAAILLAASIWTLAASPDWYRVEPRFTTIFYRILPASSDRARDAADLGLAPGDLQFVGEHAFSPGNPLNDVQWIRDFDRRGGYALIARYYLRHPQIALRFLWTDLRDNAGLIRPPNLSNFPRAAGRAPGARTARFALWSDLRSFQLRRAPALMIAWYALAVFAGWFFARHQASRPFAIGLLFASILGAGEFVFSSLTDALETFRHLLLFHLATDFTLFFALQAILARAAARPVRTQSGSPMPS